MAHDTIRDITMFVSREGQYGYLRCNKCKERASALYAFSGEMIFRCIPCTDREPGGMPDLMLSDLTVQPAP